MKKIKIIMSAIYVIWLIGYFAPIIAFLNKLKHKKVSFSFLASLYLIKKFKTSVEKINLDQKDLIEKQDKIILCFNHRTWADFFLAPYATDRKQVMIGRSILFFITPITYIGRILFGELLVLVKKGKKTKKRFVDAIEKGIDNSTCVSVHPEGHRSVNNHCLPLKPTVFQEAFKHGIPVGIIFLRGSEDIIDEKNFRFQKNQRAQIEYRKILEPKKFESFKLFFQAAKDEFALYSPEFIKEKN